jgi:hypothetical protein
MRRVARLTVDSSTPGRVPMRRQGMPRRCRQMAARMWPCRLSRVEPAGPELRRRRPPRVMCSHCSRAAFRAWFTPAAKAAKSGMPVSAGCARTPRSGPGGAGAGARGGRARHGREGVVPAALEVVAGDDPFFEVFHLLVADLDAGRVSADVQVGGDGEPAAVVAPAMAWMMTWWLASGRARQGDWLRTVCPGARSMPADQVIRAGTRSWREATRVRLDKRHPPPFPSPALDQRSEGLHVRFMDAAPFPGEKLEVLVHPRLFRQRGNRGTRITRNASAQSHS